MADVSPPKPVQRKPDASFRYIITRIEEILDAHAECLTRDGVAEAGCCIYGDFEVLVNTYYEACGIANRQPREPLHQPPPPLRVA